MKHTIKFYQESILLERITAEVDVENEDEIKDMLNEGNFSTIDVIKEDYSPARIFDIKII